MTYLPDVVKEAISSSLGTPLVGEARRHGFTHRQQADTVDTYCVPGLTQTTLVLTDRISMSGFVLPVLIPGKGEVNAALMHFWTENVLPDLHHNLKKSKAHAIFPPARTIVVEKLAHPHFQFELCYFLHGEYWEEYQRFGTVCGIKFPPNYRPWQLLSNSVLRLYPPGRRELSSAEGAFATLAKSVIERVGSFATGKGMFLVETQLEVGYSASEPTLGNLILTLDSSWFTTIQDWLTANEEERDLVRLDREPLLQWAQSLRTPWGARLNELDPHNNAHLNFVSQIEVPPSVVEECSRCHYDVFERLVGIPLPIYQRDVMGI